MLSTMRTAKVLIRLRRSVPLLFEYGINRFSYDVAKLMLKTEIYTKAFSFRPWSTLVEGKVYMMWALPRQNIL